MRHDSIQHLLAKRQTGTLTESELEELNQLTRKDETIAAAEKAATTIVRRRRIAASAVAVTLVAAGTIGLSLLTQGHDTPMVARQQPALQPIVAEEIPQAVETHTEPIAAKGTPKVTAPAATPQRQTSTHQTVEARHNDPTVMCNNQCEADSVINDIWKFLTA